MNNMKELAVNKVPCSAANGSASREDPHGSPCHMGTASSKTHLLRNGSTAKFHSLLVFLFTFSLCFYNTTSSGDGTRMAGYVFIRVYTLGEAAQEHGLMALCVFSTIKLLAARDPVPSVKSDSHSLQPLWGWDSGEQQG